MMRNEGRRNCCGFTLIEMLVVVAVIALLAAIVGITAQGWIVHGRQLGTQSQIDALSLSLNAYKTDLGSYPPRALLIEALVEGLGGNIRWSGPYHPLDQSKVGTIDPSSGLLQNARNSHLEFYDGTAVEPLYFEPGQKVFLDQFGRPIIYVPNRDYAQLGTLVRNETDYYNPTTFQLFSFGSDGKSDSNYPGSLLYTDGIDNDGDGLIDRADNLKANQRLGRQDVEDDLANW